MKLLVVSHPCATAANQSLFEELGRTWDLTLVVPAHWKDEFGNTLDEAPRSGLAGRVNKIPVWGSGRIILHAYRTNWSRLLREGGFDAIYMHHEPYALATGQVFLANRRLPRPAVFGYYSAQNIFKNYPLPFSWIERQVHRSSRFGFPVSSDVADVLRAKQTQADLTLCPLPVDLSLYFPGPASAKRSEAGVGETGFLLGYVGRIVEAKGLRTLAAALGRIRDLDWKFLVIGTGEFQGTFVELLSAVGVRDRVRFAGYVPHMETPEWLRAMDALVVPSETQPNWKEQFGRVVVEAMACGTAVVGSDSGEIPHLLRASGGGLVFRERDPANLAAALRELVVSSVRRNELAFAGSAWVAANLSQDAIARRMSVAIARAAGSC